MFRQDDNAAPTHAQFAVRVAVIGGIALIGFGAIFFRLWFLEILSGESYLKEANANRVREITIPAQRGDILDRNGNVLVDNKTVLSLQVRADELPEAATERNKELKKLAEVAGMGYDKIKQEIRTQTKLLPANPVTLQQDVDKDLAYYLLERQKDFPGVTASQQYVRDYPDGTLGAHLFGFVSEIGPDQLKEPAYDGLEPGDRIGATGLESQYDYLLRGRNGAIKVPVDAFGNPRGRQLSRVEPRGRRQPEADARREDPEGRRVGPCGLRPAGRVRGHERQRRLDPRHGLLPDLRPERLHAAGLDEDGRRAGRRRGGPAARPGDPVRLPDRLDLQVGQRIGGARERV